MKKICFCIIMFTGFTLAAHMPMTHVSTKAKGVVSATFAPLQLTAWEDCQLYDSTSHTLIALGLLNQQNSSIISFAPANGIKNNIFIQSGLVNAAENNYFAVAGLFNFSDQNYGFQIGIGNYAQNKYGFQAGLVNFGSMLQTGVYNIGGKVQVGLVNAHGDFQIGLLNYNPEAWIKWMPLFNFSLPEKENIPEKIQLPEKSEIPVVMEAF